MLLTSDLNSFGRDCALLPEKETKKANAKLNKNRIYIGDEYDRWMERKTAHRLEANSEVA